MSLKVLQFPSPESARTIRMEAISGAWDESYGPSGDTSFLSTWLEGDCEANRAPGGINWGPISGLALAVAVGTGFWTGVVVIIERILR